MKQFKLPILALAIAISSGSALAAVNIDENGVGFVGKGDVQQAFDWNNAMLQSNAHSLQFRFAPSATVTWTCEGINPAGRVVIQQYETMDAVAADIAFDPRRNRNGQITGFIMNGTTGSHNASYSVPGSCGNNNGQDNWVERPTLVGEINYTGNDEPALEVSVDGATWLVLPITYF